MEIAHDTATKEITIKGVLFTVPAPFTEGHVLRANEADVLNQTLAENLRNNFASTVAAAVEAAGSIEGIDLNELQSQLNDYISGYDFGVRRSGGGTGAPKLEPRIRIARDIAKEKVKEAIKAKGKKVSDFDATKLNELAMSLVEKDAFYLEEADRRIKVQQKAAAASIDLSGLDISDEDEYVEAEEAAA